jgi:hypothetical protein
MSVNQFFLPKTLGEAFPLLCMVVGVVAANHASVSAVVYGGLAIALFGLLALIMRLTASYRQARMIAQARVRAERRAKFRESLGSDENDYNIDSALEGMQVKVYLS